MNVRKIHYFLPFFIALAVSAHAALTPTQMTTMGDGLTSYLRGDFDKAVAQWASAAEQARTSNNNQAYAEALWRQAEAYRALGLHSQAARLLAQAQPIAKQVDDKLLMVNILASISDSLAHTGSVSVALKFMEQAVSITRQTGNQKLLAVALNNFGNVLVKNNKYDAALQAYQESSEIAASSNNPSLRIKAMVNAMHLQLDIEPNSKEKISQTLREAIGLHTQLPVTHSSTLNLTSMGRLSWQLYKDGAANNSDWLRHTYTLLSKADAQAKSLGDFRAESYTAGYLGEMYDFQGRQDEALLMTERAIFAAQQAEAPESAYLWHWQAGRLYKKKNNMDEAIVAYRQAVTNIQTIRQQLATKTAFKDVLGPVFFELTDLLLQRPNSLADKSKVDEYLKEARQTMELLKAAELQDYFQDQCVTAQQSKITKLDNLDSRTAVLYPILLEDRMEILLSLSDGMDRAVVPIQAEELRAQITRFRILLEKRTTHQYMHDARALYDMLIRPMEAKLQSHDINTLVIVPDRTLRTIPMAALHDGKNFLVAKYALGTTPGLSLTDPKPLERNKMDILVGGLTESVQGFSALPNVANEIENINNSYKSTILKDSTYLAGTMKSELGGKQYNMVHVASHAQFSDNPEETFLLTYDDKFTMDKLEDLMSQKKYSDDPIELLTLSACQTAAGDERAALGLAGIAIKAGVRSALATLWFINDQSSSLLISEFYEQMQNSSQSKVQALQQAQLKLMTDRRFRHPSYWSPFLMIGSWL
jgi:CHAT domain-containing protein